MSEVAFFNFSKTTESRIWWLLRMGIAWEFIGHGAFGIITKEGWLPYFAVWGIPESVAWKLMPVVGTIDIILGLMAFFAPRKGLILFMATWGLMTALLRPFAGEPWSEFFERSYNWGVPLVTFLVISWDSKFHGWLNRVKNIPSLNANQWQILSLILRGVIFSYMVGHGAFGVLDAKTGLINHYEAIGVSKLLGTTQTALMIMGSFEIVLGVAALFVTFPLFFYFISGWKIATESLFIFSGAFFGGFEFIERGASYAAPVVLALIMRLARKSTYKSVTIPLRVKSKGENQKS